MKFSNFLSDLINVKKGYKNLDTYEFVISAY